MFKKLSIVIIIAILIILILVNMYRFYVSVFQSDSSTIVSNKEVLLSPARKVIAADSIVNWHLLGQTEAVQAVKAPKTTLKLTIKGILSSTDTSQARVIIEMSRNKDKYFKEGDKIRKNVTIKSIHSDYIVIRHNSREEIVSLKNNSKKNSLLQK